MPPISNHRATPSPRKEKEIYPNQFTFARHTLITLTEETLPPLPATESIITIDQSPFLLSLFPIIEKNQRAYPPLRSGIDYARIYERHGDTLSRGEWAIIQLSFVENSYARRIVAGRGTARRGRLSNLKSRHVCTRVALPYLSPGPARIIFGRCAEFSLLGDFRCAKPRSPPNSR